MDATPVNQRRFNAGMTMRKLNITREQTQLGLWHAEQNRKKIKSPQYVYVLLSIGDSYAKIGMSRKHPEKGRMREIQGCCPFKLCVFVTRRVEFPFRRERELHEKYAAFRVTGEWFKLDQEGLDAVRRDILAYREKPEVVKPKKTRDPSQPAKKKVWTFGHTVRATYGSEALAQHYRDGTGPFAQSDN